MPARARALRTFVATAAWLSLLPLAAGAFPVEETVLENGLRIWSRSLPGSGRAAVRVVVQAGSGDEQSGPGGIAHVLEHTLFDRIEDPTIREAQLDLEQDGAYVNAYTTIDSTYAALDLFAEQLSPALALTARQLDFPQLTEELLEHHLQIVQRELEEYPDDALLLWLLYSLYGDHAIARGQGGDPNTLLEIEAAQLRRFHARHYQPHRIIAIVVADAAREEIIEAVRTHFGERDWPVAPSGTTETPEPLREPGPVVLEDEDWGGTLMRGFVAPSARDPDHAALWLVQELLEAHLYEELRDRRALSYGPFVYLTSGRFEGLLYLEAYGHESSFDTITRLFDEEMARIMAGEVTARELEDIQHRVSRRTEREHAQPEVLADYLAWQASFLQPGEAILSPSEMLRHVSVTEFTEAARRLGAERNRIDVHSVTLPAPVISWSSATLLGFGLLVLLQILVVSRLRHRSAER